MVYFTADTHFGHNAIIRMCGRPFEDVNEMNRALIDLWNARVHGDDTIYIVGDMFYRCTDVESILRRLHGRKRLILGNHDESWLKQADYGRYFISIDHYLEISDGAHALTLCHYPMVTWKHDHRSYMIHGHIHANTDADFWPLLRERERALNAGVDINGYQPVTFDELIANNRCFKELHP